MKRAGAPPPPRENRLSHRDGNASAPRNDNRQWVYQTMLNVKHNFTAGRLRQEAFPRCIPWYFIPFRRTGIASFPWRGAGRAGRPPAGRKPPLRSAGHARGLPGRFPGKRPIAVAFSQHILYQYGKTSAPEPHRSLAGRNRARRRRRGHRRLPAIYTPGLFWYASCFEMGFEKGRFQNGGARARRRGGRDETSGRDINIEERGGAGGKSGKGPQGPCRPGRSLRAPVSGTGRFEKSATRRISHDMPREVPKNVFTNRRKNQR